VWRTPWLHTIGIIKAPNLEGDWEGYVSSSFDKQAEKHNVKVRIRQNWTHMSIRLETHHSESRSVVASIYVADEVVLNYQYENVPGAQAKTTMHTHKGTAMLKWTEMPSRLRGDYYSGRDRENHGVLVLHDVAIRPEK
jgi:hypothetical protein